MPQDLEITSSAYWLIKHKFDYADTLKNFCDFADRVTVAVNTCNDGTYEALNQWKTDNKADHLNFIQCDIDEKDPWLDGKVKNVALQSTIFPYKVGLDFDERIPIWQKPKWVELGKMLEPTDFKAVMIASLDLWGDVYTLPWDAEKNIAVKWYATFDGVHRRPIWQAVMPDGKLNHSLSDGCEACSPDGQLVKAAFTLPMGLWNKVKGQKDITEASFKEYMTALNQVGLFVYHLGYANFENRILRNHEWWKDQWARSSADKVEIPMSEFELFKMGCYKHGLRLWNE